MLQKFKQHIAANFPFLSEKKLLIAISGGVDSVVLTHILQQLDCSIALAHCNFNLRGNESDADEKFVKTIGEKLQVKTFIKQFDTEKFAKKKKQSTQIAARNLRYAWFQELTEKHTFNYVLTAHHADDNLETFLINLTRGTGLDGLTGIPAINGNIVRPLLSFSRDEIVRFATENAIDWREDKSNAATKYIRNKIRHQIVPVLKEINPNLLGSFQKTSEYLHESRQLIEDRIESIKKDIISTTDNQHIKINIQHLNALSNPKAYIYQVLKGYNFTEWNDVADLLSAQSGKQVFSRTHRLIKDRDFLLLTAIEQEAETSEYFISKNTKKITFPVQLTFEKAVKTSFKDLQTIFLDTTKITFPLILRKWERGDYFYPTGMQGKKKISNYFKDEKYSLINKENTWLLCSKNDIVWIVGKRQDKRFLPSSTTTSILKIHMPL
ncbi:MAG: tRNA lysidine(34) synthetase TilS [Polaribacter sp.]|nr:tRNA lysidine(34) synthetase TilS [Polaribacter sp.]